MQYIQPDWSAPKNIHAYTTTRHGGVSIGDFAEFNLGFSTLDEPKNIEKNRQLLQEQLALPTPIHWLKQTHGTDVAVLPTTTTPPILADASITMSANTVCIVLTADCLPVLLCDKKGETVAAVHAGWRGLSQGILTKTIQHFKTAPENILAWLGPAIGPAAFEVGVDVYDAFVSQNPDNRHAFTAKKAEKYYANLYQLARAELTSLGLQSISGGNRCTHTEQDWFYSHRRSPKTGRMASLIWRT